MHGRKSVIGGSLLTNMQFDWTLKFADLAIVFATLLGPILAIQAQKWLEKERAVKERRMWIFRVLMATRAARLTQQHVEALNSIPIEFYGTDKKLRTIVEAWKAYLDHTGATIGEGGFSNERWNEKYHELYIELLYLMSQFLGYEFNKVELVKEFYSPKSHHWIESDQEIIRKGLAKLFSGELAIPMDIRKLPVDDDAAKEQSEIRKSTLKWLAGDSAVGIQIKQRDESRPT